LIVKRKAQPAYYFMFNDLLVCEQQQAWRRVARSILIDQYSGGHNPRRRRALQVARVSLAQ